MRASNAMSKRWAVIVVLLAAGLAGCDGISPATPEPVATPVVKETGYQAPEGAVVSSGVVVPPESVDVSFTTSGRIASVSVAVGDTVEAGEVLAVLETSSLESGVAVALASVAAAEAQLALLTAPRDPHEIAAAEANLAAAEAALAGAEAQRDQPGLGATAGEVSAAQASVTAAIADQREADEFHEKTMTCVRLDVDGEEMTICPALGVIEEGARHGLHVANAAQVAAQAELDALLAGAGAELRAAQAGVELTSAQRDAAVARLALLNAGVPAEAIAAAEARVDQAQAAVFLAEVALDQATLRAPCAGTVAALQAAPGVIAMPGQLVLTVAPLGSLQVETTDLSERQVTRISTGQPATVYFEPLDAEAGGRVVALAPRATSAGGDVVYAVQIALDEQPPGIRWGMSGEVAIEPPATGGTAAQAAGAQTAADTISGSVIGTTVRSLAASR